MSKFRVGDRITDGVCVKLVTDISNGNYHLLFPDRTKGLFDISDIDEDYELLYRYEKEIPDIPYDNTQNTIDNLIPKKYNEGKPRTDLISGEFILGLGKALQYGADKYDESKEDTPNYLKGDGFFYSDLIGALERHMAKFKSGINRDEESDLEHIIQVAVNAMFLYNYRISGRGIDNRVVLNEKK